MTNKIIASIALIVSIMTQTACIKVELHDTDHPNHGKIISLTTVWDDKAANIPVPDAYTAAIGEHTVTLQQQTAHIEHLFPAGQYPIHIYNAVNGISVNATTATADYATGEIGWFFTGTENAIIENDKDHAFTVHIHQMVRQLTLELEITGNAANHIARIEASLSGIAGAINIENGNPVGNPVTVVPIFTKIDGKYTATIRLLGVTGTAQTLTLHLYAQNDPAPVFTLISDLANQLAAFNADRKTPLSLRTNIEANLNEAGFTAVIDNWTNGNGGNVIAD